MNGNAQRRLVHGNATSSVNVIHCRRGDNITVAVQLVEAEKNRIGSLGILQFDEDTEDKAIKN